MKYIGMIMVTLAVYWFGNEYVKRVKNNIGECEAFLKFIAHMKIQMSGFARSPKEIAESFECDRLKKTGFLDAVSSEDNIYLAYTKIKDTLSLGREESEVLEPLFDALSEVSLEEGIALLESAGASLREISERRKQDGEKSIKLAYTVSSAISLGFIIFAV